jgi:hypothetical protein
MCRISASKRFICDVIKIKYYSQFSLKYTESKKTQNELTGEATRHRRHARDSVLPMRCIEFYKDTGHETSFKYA